MDSLAVMEWLFQQTGPVAVAAMALYFMQKNHSAYMERERENAQIHREDKQAIMKVLADNNIAKTRLYEAIGHLEQTIERRNRVIEAGNGDD